MNRSLRVAVAGLLASVSLHGGTLLGCGGSTSIETKYASESGQFVLRIQPSDPEEGRGKAQYRLLLHDKETWNETLPFTLVRAHVLNDGTVVGYAYTAGASGRYGDRWSEYGDLLFAVLSPQGDVRVREAFQRAFGRRIVTDQLPEPLATDLVADPDNDRVVFLATWNGYEFGKPATTAWRVYQLSTGKPLGVFYPAEQMEDARWLRSCLALRPLPGTPLLIAQWVRMEGKLSEENPPIWGTHFALLDEKCSPVWQLVLRDDYEVPGNKQREKRLFNWIRENGAILSVSKQGQFDLYFARKGQRVSFATKQDKEGKWVIREAARKHFAPDELVESPSGEAVE